MKKLLFILVLLIAAPTFAATQIDLETQVKGILPQANGGTGATSVLTVSGTPAVGDLLYMNGSNTAALLSPGTLGTVLTSAGAATPPTWGTAGGSPGGTNGQIQFNNAGAFGGIATTGTGDAVLATSPTLITPVLGTASATAVTTSGALSTTGTLALNSLETVSAAGTTQGTCTALSATKTVHLVGTATTNQGVCLPAASTVGQIHFVRQTQASPVNYRIWPAVGDTILGLAINTNVAAQGGQGYLFIVTSANNWVLLSNTLVNGTNMNFAFDSNSGQFTAATATSITYTQRLIANSNAIASATAPSSPVACTSPTVTAANGTASFTVNVGTSCAGVSTLALTMPSTSVAVGWNCLARNITNGSTSAPAQTGAASTSSITITNFARTTGLAANWTASDVIGIACLAH